MACAPGGHLQRGRQLLERAQHPGVLGTLVQRERDFQPRPARSDAAEQLFQSSFAAGVAAHARQRIARCQRLVATASLTRVVARASLARPAVRSLDLNGGCTSGQSDHPHG